MTPLETASLYLLGERSSRLVPWDAAEWLADGYDGESLRELAGLGADQAHEIRELFPAALAELGWDWPSASQAMLVWITVRAREVVAGRIDLRELLAGVWHLADARPDVPPLASRLAHPGR